MSVPSKIYRGHRITVVGNYGHCTAIITRSPDELSAQDEMTATVTAGTVDGCFLQAQGHIDQHLRRHPLTEIIYAPVPYVPAVVGASFPVGVPPFLPSTVKRYVEFADGTGRRLWLPALDKSPT